MGEFHWIRCPNSPAWTIGDIDGDGVTVIGMGMPMRTSEVDVGPRIEPPRLPVLTVDADGNHMLRWDDGSPLRTEVHVLAAASTPAGTLTVDGGTVTVVAVGETVRLHSRLREDGTLEWVTDEAAGGPGGDDVA